MKKPSPNPNRKQPTAYIPVRQIRAVPPLVRLLLFVEAGGRCEFDGCNKYLLEHHVTLTTGIAARYPELSHRLGPRRKLWQAEKYSMSLFDAAALGAAYVTDNETVGNPKDGAIWPVPR